MTQVFLVSGSTNPWSVPADWNNSDNQVELLSRGGNGAAGAIGRNALGGGGGAGGSYAQRTNLTLSGSVYWRVGTSSSAVSTRFGNDGTNGSNWFGIAGGGNASGGTGGTTGGSTPETGGTPPGTAGNAYAGGAGGSSGKEYSGSGGGGAAGPNGAGKDGGAGNVAGSGNGAAGGGGANGGSSTAGTSANVNDSGGVQGGHGNDGTGGGYGAGWGDEYADDGGAGKGAGGGGGQGIKQALVTYNSYGGYGSTYTGGWDGVHGPGGGGGGGGSMSIDGGSSTVYASYGRAGGDYGGGGGGGGQMRGSASTSTGGAGAPGLIAITYTPGAQAGSALLAGSGSLASAASHTPSAAALLPGAGALKSNALSTKFASASFAGAGQLQADAVKLAQQGAALLAGAGALTSAASSTKQGSALLPASGSFASNLTHTPSGAALISGAGALAVDAALAAGVLQGAALLAGAVALSASSEHTPVGEALLAAAGSLAVDVTTSAKNAEATLPASGSLAVDASHVPQARAALAGSGSLVANAARLVVVWQGSALLAGGSALSMPDERTTHVNEPSGINGNAGYTMVARDVAIPAGSLVTKLGLYSQANLGVLRMKIMQRNSPGNYTTLLSQNCDDQHPNTGWFDFTLATPYQLPASGEFFVGEYSPDVHSHCNGHLRAYLTGDSVGTQTLSENNSYIQSLSFTTYRAAVAHTPAGAALLAGAGSLVVDVTTAAQAAEATFSASGSLAADASHDPQAEAALAGVGGLSVKARLPSAVSQEHFRFRTDANAVDDAAVWGADEDSNFYPRGNVPFRLRLAIKNASNSPTESLPWQIMVSKNGGSYTPVTISSDGVRSYDAGASADETGIINKLLSGAP